MTDGLPSNPADKNRDLFFSALSGDTARMRKLLAAGADANTRQARQDYAPQVSALYAAADAGQMEAVRLLVAHKAKLDEGTYEGRTPLMAAIMRGDAAMAEFLLESGAKAHLRYGPETLVDMAERNDNPQPMLRLLLSRMTKERLGEIFLDAARDARPAVIKAALSLKCVDVHQRDHTGNTALILAAQNGARPESAAQVTRLLLEKGAEVDAENDLQETALSAAVMKQPVSADSIRLLVDAGADITRTTLAGITAYEAAQLTGNEKILPCFEAARRQRILRDVKKHFEGTGNNITIRSKPFPPGRPRP